MQPITFFHLLLALIISGGLSAQTVKETNQALSKKASKGFIYKIDPKENGGLEVTYKIPGDKKKEEVFFEKYTFGTDLAYVGSEAANIPKTTKENITKTYYYTVVGGCTSFDILSMKLKLYKRVVEQSWSEERQRYIFRKTISSETLKARNDNGKVYIGCAGFLGNEDEGKEIFNIVRVEGEKGKIDQYFVLMINHDLEMREIPFNMTGDKTLVYTTQFENNDVVAVFAPRKGSADLKKYNYFLFSEDGTVKEQAEFTSPANALLISAAFVKNGSVYFCGNSVNDDDPYEKTFAEYASIQNPCYTDGANYQDQKWRKSSESEMDNFHFIRFTGNKMDFSSSTPVKDFKAKLVTSAEDKGADAYKGKKFSVDEFYITAKGEFIVSGQLTGWNKIGESMVKSYEDVVCLHFDNTGKLRAQYGVKKMNTDKKSEIFDMPQRFIASADGTKLYWEILEVKGTKGYESFMDAYNGNASFYANFFPRLLEIDLEKTSIGKSKVLGAEKYYVRGAGKGIWNESERSMLYVGHDEDREFLWVATVKFD